MKASLYLACRAALPSGLSLSSALLCPVLLASLWYWILTSLSSTHPNQLLTGRAIGNGSVPRSLLLTCSNKMRLQFSYCIYSLTCSFCIQFSQSLVRLRPPKYHSQHITREKPKLFIFNQEMEAELEKKAERNYDLLAAVYSAGDLLGLVLSWKLPRSWATAETYFQ